MTFHLNDFVPYRLNIAAAQVSRRFAALYKTEAGLSIPEWRVLAHLNGSGALSVRDIVAKVNLEKSVVSRAADSLSQASYLAKSLHTQDQRLVALELTEQGRDLMQRLGRIAEDFQTELLIELGVDGDAFSRALTRLVESK
ncbi:MarR family winged helix-turn-helix transcriptional regulator (plasmid) [Rhizobium sp. 32-5/1]|uniref:MarR family winged helix-turn-helix transcriptional regulator n=1 Tax=Rhizobium sp. 32-5/1 TaxID=3019602 RepID=UPI00240D87EA|nr:MarR family winged helix-turn-helix transcriptional regulator [Rhizobium sp. 32-5/1]WEZ85354.1 MarR family winged helix-turn-helix transcriptional regulator [Rhizobium sp. 32-5/1]